MGLFKTENCPICNKPTGALAKSSAKYNGLFVCQSCAKKLTANGILLIRLNKYSLDELQKITGTSKEDIQKHLTEVSSFQATKKVGNFIHFDDVNNKFAVPHTSITGAVNDLQIFDYSDLLDFELIEDGNSISKGGVGRALVGGALFGSVGAIVGGSTGHKQKSTCSKLQVKITLNNIKKPTVYINFIETETPKDGFVYKQLYGQAQEILSLLEVVTHSNTSSTVASSNNVSAADEILKLKHLLNIGVISQDEFDAKKKQLLGL